MKSPRLAFLILVLVGSAHVTAQADHSVVLVANADAPIDSLSPLDLRKLYMGFVVTSKDGQPIQPVFNSSSSRLQELFLQDVMGMSARTYDRRLLSLTLRTGRSRPVSYENVDDLLTRLQRDRHAVAFVWSEDVADADNIKIVRVLWRR